MLLNFSTEEADFFQPADMDPSKWQLLLSNYPASADLCAKLRPYEARVFYQREASSL